MTNKRMSFIIPDPDYSKVLEVQAIQEKPTITSTILFLIRIGHKFAKAQSDPNKRVVIQDIDTGNETELLIIS